MILSATKCSVPIVTLRSTPFSLPWGSNVFVKVIASNLYGDSVESEEGSQAIILTNPDAPRYLLENLSARSSNSITFSWTQGVANGGANVLDYRISFDQALGIYIVRASEITATSYTATGLTAGLTYKFKVESRNSFGYSDLSSEISIICATLPSIPATP